MFKILLTLFLTLIATNSFSSDEQIDFSPSIIKDGQQKILALSFRNLKGWHSYWKNPGDAGIPLSFEFKLDEEPVKLEQYNWPTPIRFIGDGDVRGFGYSGLYAIFFKIPSTNKTGRLTINSKWLACNNICIPGQKTVTGTISDAKFTPDVKNNFNVTKESLLQYFYQLPKKIQFPADLDFTIIREKKKGLTLYYSIKSNFIKLPAGNNLLIPYISDPFSFKHEHLYLDQKGNVYGKMNIEWDGEYEEPPVPLPSSGKFNKTYILKFLFNQDSSSTIIEKEIKSFSIGTAKRINDLYALFKEIKVTNTPHSKSILKLTEENNEEDNNDTQSSFLYFIFLAFIGGLILNLMPCVLPVISLKLFGMIKHKHLSKGQILKHNLSYTAGILISFGVLAGTVVILKASGEMAGWGFQLQSPTFLAIMVIAIFIFSLNLFGLFEFKIPGGKIIGEAEVKNNLWGDFLNGIFATVLSTPCSAPFLGTALAAAFAVNSPPYITFFIFFSVGIGLASPFILTALVPATIKFLPHPGAWMDNLRKFLAITLVLTTIWLLDVFLSTTNDKALVQLNIILVMTFFSFYLGHKITKKIAYKIISWIIPLAFLINLFIGLNKIQVVNTNHTTTQKIIINGQPWNRWSPQLLDTLRQKGEVVFMDFTANWCFTCKVNEKMVIHTDAFNDLVKKYKLKLLIGDWTKKDPVISRWLKEQNVYGVPAYFIQTIDGKIINLGELISIDKIEEQLRKL